MTGRHPSGSAWTAWLAVLLVTVPAAGPLAAALPGDPAPAGGGDLRDCTPHPPITVRGDKGPTGFELSSNPATGTPAYRPGSGVVAGDGTAASPYVIEGWCISPTAAGDPHAPEQPDASTSGAPDPDPRRHAGIWIADTDAHVVVRATVVDGLTADWWTRENTRQLLLEHGIHLDNASHVRVEDVLVTNTDEAGIVVEDARAVRVADTRVVDNAGHGVRVQQSASVVLANSAITDNDGHGIVLEDAGAHVRGGLVAHNNGDGIHKVQADGGWDTPGQPPGTCGPGPAPGVLPLPLPATLPCPDQLCYEVGGPSSPLATVDEAAGTDLCQPGGLGVGPDDERRSPTVIENATVRENGGAGVNLAQDTGFGGGLDGGFGDAPNQGPLVTRSTIASNAGPGLAVPAGARVLDNVVTDNELGVRASDAEATVVHGNNLQGNGLGLEGPASSGYGSTASLNATGNWWGCAGGPADPACDAVEGVVTVDPWLGQPNPDAGAP